MFDWPACLTVKMEFSKTQMWKESEHQIDFYGIGLLNKTP